MISTIKRLPYAELILRGIKMIEYRNQPANECRIAQSFLQVEGGLAGAVTDPSGATHGYSQFWGERPPALTAGLNSSIFLANGLIASTIQLSRGSLPASRLM